MPKPRPKVTYWQQSDRIAGADTSVIRSVGITGILAHLWGGCFEPWRGPIDRAALSTHLETLAATTAGLDLHLGVKCIDGSQQGHMVPWDNDQGWRDAAENFGFLAEEVARIGAKSILIDSENYWEMITNQPNAWPDGPRAGERAQQWVQGIRSRNTAVRIGQYCRFRAEYQRPGYRAFWRAAVGADQQGPAHSFFFEDSYWSDEFRYGQEVKMIRAGLGSKRVDCCAGLVLMEDPRWSKRFPGRFADAIQSERSTIGGVPEVWLFPNREPDDAWADGAEFLATHAVEREIVRRAISGKAK